MWVQDLQAACRVLPALPTRGGSRGSRENITVCHHSVPGCSSAEGDGSGERWRPKGLGLFRTRCAPHGVPQPSACRSCVGDTGRLAARPDGEPALLCGEQIRGARSPGSESCLFESRSPMFSPSHCISARYTPSICDSHPAQAVRSPLLEV